MKINVSITPPKKKGKFALIQLSAFLSPIKETKVNLRINYNGIYSFTYLKKGVTVDLFVVASIIYGIDNLISRVKHSIDGWSRDLEVCLPVYDDALWNTVRLQFEENLNFLTGDFWRISFVKHANFMLYRENEDENLIEQSKDGIKLVSLFSGGLDSLVGVIDTLKSLKEEIIVLASHYDSNIPCVKKDQQNLNHELSIKFLNKYIWVQTCVSLDELDICENKIIKEPSLRSRSLLFLSIGLLLANSISKKTIVFIPENGTMSLNYPLTPSRRSSCSTRTAHPYYLNGLQKIIEALGLHNLIINPYQFMTKGEMLKNCKDKILLKKTIRRSGSCAKLHTKPHWDKKIGIKHCGICMPCLYRRAALNEINIVNELYGVDIFSTKKELKAITDLPALFDFLKKRKTLEEIEKELLINGSLPLAQIKEYAMVIERTRSEVKHWISTSDNKKLKKLAGVK